MSDREPGSGVAVWIALRRAHQGGVATLHGHWFDSGRLVPGYVADALDRLTRTGLLVISEADPESCGVRRVTVTDAGCAHYEVLCQLHNPKASVVLRVPDPQFPTTKTPAGRWSSCPAPLPAPGGQPDHRRQAGGFSVGQLRWAHCPDDRRLHLLQPAEVVVAETGSHAEALCGQPLPAAGLTLASGSSRALCMACMDGIPSPSGSGGTP